MDIRLVLNEALYRQLLIAQEQTSKPMGDLIRAAIEAYLKGLGV